jgi:hypothetical protein
VISGYLNMKTMILAAITALSLGLGVANAAVPSHNSGSQQGDQFNFVRGGGG